MARPLAWRGGLEDAAALARRVDAGEAVALALRPDLVPDFVLEAQAAALGLPLADDAAAPDEAGDIAAALARGFRGFIVAAPERELLGRFVERAEEAAGCRTLAIEGGLFRRRVDVVVGDEVDHSTFWRLEVGLRGC